MLFELLIGFLIAFTLLYLFYLYMDWNITYAPVKVLYDELKATLKKEQIAYIEKYHPYILPEYIVDGFKPVRFWILYYMALYGF